jgi:uncharacterized repeat protein (TIGR04076 family)
MTGESDDCRETTAGPTLVQVTVTGSTCDKMPAGDTLVLDGPAIDYDRSGPVCLTAMNAVYPWIMLARFGVETEVLDYDAEAGCYHAACPCGIVNLEIRRLY